MTELATLLAYAAAILVLSSNMAALVLAEEGWRLRRNSLDLAYAASAASLMACVFAGQVGPPWTGHPAVVFTACALLQATFCAVAFFMLLGASVTRFEVHLVWMLQLAAGLALAAWFALGLPGDELARPAWALMNLVAATTLCALTGWVALRSGRTRHWMVFALGALGVAVCAQVMLDFLRPAGDPAGWPVLATWIARFAFVGLLPLLWLGLTDRAVLRAQGGLADAGAPASQTWVTVTCGLFTTPERATAAALASERQRIAHDMHDGVGAQLVYLLSTLNPLAAGQAGMAAGLERCLLDLKISVDNLGADNASVAEALARLRSRVQPGLDRMGVALDWSVDEDGPLGELRGETAQHIVRIVQEALSNCMRHANATRITFECVYVADPRALHVQVVDNGCGMPGGGASRAPGKGLAHMHWRAVKLDARLLISTRPGAGVRASLFVPLDRRWLP